MCNQSATLPVLYFVTLTYFFKVKYFKCHDIYMISICFILRQLRVQASTSNTGAAGVWNQTCDLERTSTEYRTVTPAQHGYNTVEIIMWRGPVIQLPGGMMHAICIEPNG